MFSTNQVSSEGIEVPRRANTAGTAEGFECDASQSPVFKRSETDEVGDPFIRVDRDFETEAFNRCCEVIEVHLMHVLPGLSGNPFDRGQVLT